MARKIKFALEMADGTLVSNLEDLQKHIKNNDDVKKLVEYFLDGRLEKWLLDRYYEGEAKKLQSVDKDDPDFTCKLCKAIGADYTPSEPVNVALIEHEMRIRKALEEVTSDSKIIANAGCTASTKSELDFLIKNGKKTIYLWGDSFKLPLVHNISYIGILGNPLVDIDFVDLDSFKSYSIKFENLNLPEAIRKAEEEVIRRITEEARRKVEVSKYGLEARLFDSESNNWADSEIRKWLNGEFYNKAFTDQEKKSIKFSNLSDVSTIDNVFLLNKEEADKYFANDEKRKCKVTDYAMKNGAWVAGNDYSVWWLRSPYSNCISIVCLVDFNGCSLFSSVHFGDFLVRPALWINL